VCQVHTLSETQGRSGSAHNPLNVDDDDDDDDEDDTKGPLQEGELPRSEERELPRSKERELPCSKERELPLSKERELPRSKERELPEGRTRSAPEGSCMYQVMFSTCGVPRSRGRAISELIVG
jgi:hypothetical protein